MYSEGIVCGYTFLFVLVVEAFGSEYFDVEALRGESPLFHEFGVFCVSVFHGPVDAHRVEEDEGKVLFDFFVDGGESFRDGTHTVRVVDDDVVRNEVVVSGDGEVVDGERACFFFYSNYFIPE